MIVLSASALHLQVMTLQIGWHVMVMPWITANILKGNMPLLKLRQRSIRLVYGKALLLNRGSGAKVRGERARMYT